MVRALLGRKVGMTRLFEEDGRTVPATVLEVGPCRVMQVKTPQTDGYAAVQIGFVEKKRRRATKPERGHAAKAGCAPHRFLCEVPVTDSVQVAPGQTVTVAIFKGVAAVDVSGVTKGRGFSGGVRRWGFGGLGSSHGVHGRHRAPGSIGSNSDPGRVLRGLHMAGRFGGVRRTVKRLKVLRVDEEKNLLVVRGAVPGPNGGCVTVRACAAGSKT